MKSLSFHTNFCYQRCSRHVCEFHMLAYVFQPAFPTQVDSCLFFTDIRNLVQSDLSRYSSLVLLLSFDYCDHQTNAAFSMRGYFAFLL